MLFCLSSQYIHASSETSSFTSFPYTTSRCCCVLWNKLRYRVLPVTVHPVKHQCSYEKLSEIPQQGANRIFWSFLSQLEERYVAQHHVHVSRRSITRFSETGKYYYFHFIGGTTKTQWCKFILAAPKFKFSAHQSNVIVSCDLNIIWFWFYPPRLNGTATIGYRYRVQGLYHCLGTAPWALVGEHPWSWKGRPEARGTELAISVQAILSSEEGILWFPKATFYSQQSKEAYVCTYVAV